MRKEQYEALRDWFDGYVESFRGIPALGPWVELKECHTRRVTGIIVRIGSSLGLPEEDLFLARTIALLHDVGRFRQIQRYGTFNDRRSENHALSGVAVLRQAGALDGLAAGEAGLVLRAVERHNLRELPPDPDPRFSLFARLVQDADKLDILDMFTRYYGGEDAGLGGVLDVHLPDTPGMSAALVEDVLQGKLGNYSDLTSSHG
ncbi:MAG: HD domain-containing protein [Peptococcaceae bacterium]|nr:HD domain-containing protein [Peptococcaceae bacterium]